MENHRKNQRRYIHGFDGLRSLAVIGVIFYHLMPSSMRGGYLGVPVFFVLSGYLITDLLRQEWQREGKIHLKSFYLRRIKRLYPALVALLIVSSAYITLFQRNLLNNLRGIVSSSLLYVNNWWQIQHGFSYFDRFGNESPFTHLWSLAVEGQNYLIWPLLFLLLMKLVKNKARRLQILLGATLLSAVLMAVLFQPGGDPTRVYYGTDTRLFSIWLGSLLAFVWPSTQLSSHIPVQARRILNLSGGVALLLLALAFFFLDGRYTFVYYGGMYVISLVILVLVAVIAHPGSSWSKWLTNPVFDYLGKRSYSLYLYQFPVMIFYEAKVKNIAENLWLHTLIEMVLIVLLSECSYRFVETPGRQWTLKGLLIQGKDWFRVPKGNRQIIKRVSVLFVILVSLVGFTIAPKNTLTKEQESFQKAVLENQKIAEETQKNTFVPSENETQNSEVAAEQSAAMEEIMTRYTLTKEQVEMAQTMELTAFGDSVMLGAAQDLQTLFPNVVIDAVIGRQLYDCVDDLKQLKADGLLKEQVLIGLGSNGPASEAQFDQMMHVLGDRQVYLVNTRVPTQRWQNEVNQLLAKMAEKYDKVTLVDWYSQTEGQAAWFREDQVHPNEQGLIEYTSLVGQQLLTK
ncbi:acyltransferase family protein [Enterococcus sp. LJL98]